MKSKVKPEQMVKKSWSLELSKIGDLKQWRYLANKNRRR